MKDIKEKKKKAMIREQKKIASIIKKAFAKADKYIEKDLATPNIFSLN